MEDTLRVTDTSHEQLLDVWVLILILMEDTLRDIKNALLALASDGLNPYSNGRYSESAFPYY